MAKAKNKKKPMADAAAKKRKQDKKKSINPFEVRINRDKQNVLGRKSKSDHGLPGIARSKAIQKRKHTLLQEYNLRDKDNVFMDRRIGERNTAMTPEERSLARYAAEQIKAHKKNIYSLNDEEIQLTHKGQTLAEIEKFEDPRSDDEFSEDGDNKKGGHLDKKFVGDAHFGGGILSKPSGTLSHAEIIDQLIHDSKKRKAEQQREKEKQVDETEKLDTDWKDLQPLMAAFKRKPDDPPPVKTPVDDYDRAVRELKFESRGKPSDRLKSQEEIMKEEKDKLEALEQDRLIRMKGFLNASEGKAQHKSADDLDDGFVVEDVNEDALAYGEDGLLKGAKFDSKPSVEADEEDKVDDNSDVTSAEDNESEKDDEETNAKLTDCDDDNKDLPEAAEDCDEDSEDDLSDLKMSDTSSDEEEEKIPSINDQTIKLKKQQKPTEQMEVIEINQNNEINPDRIKEIREDLQRRKQIMDKARQELPYTYSAPESYEQLAELLKKHGPEHQSIILERIIKCNHWSLNSANRVKLCGVFEYLLKHIVNCFKVTKAVDIVKAFQISDRLCPHLYDLAQANASNTAICVQNIIKEQHESFEKNPKKYPGIDTLIVFKLVSLLFPTSDFRHPVVTPCLVFMSQILLRCRVKCKTDISKGLFIVTLLLEYTLMSKRFMPSAINYLRGIIYVSMIKLPPLLPSIIPPFKRAGEFSNLLVLEANQKEFVIETTGALMHAIDLAPSNFDDEFKVRTLLTAVNLINEFKNQLDELEAAPTIFQPIIKLLKKSNWKNYPTNVRQRVKEVRAELKSLSDKKLEYMVRDKKKPKALRLYEPKIERVYVEIFL